MRSRWAILVLLLAGIVSYANTAKNGLFWDDDEFITRNAYIRSFRYLPQWFSQPLTAGAGVNSNYYRPLLTASFSLDYHLWGLWPAGYHLENMLWHTAAAILLYFFLKEFLPQIFNFQLSTFNSATMIALATSLLWLLHPVQVEAVAYANSRGDSMATVFILLSLILWLKNRFWASAIAFIAALLSKEFAIVTPGLIVLVESLRGSRAQSRETWQSHEIPTGRTGWYIPRNDGKIKTFLVIMSIAVIYLLLRLTVLNFQNTLNFYGTSLTRSDLCSTQRSDLCIPIELYATSLKVRILTFFKVLPIYAGILVWPTDLHMERTVEIATTIKDPVVLSSLAVILASVGFFGWAPANIRKLWRAGTSEPRSHALRGCARRAQREVSVLWGHLLFFGFTWFFLSILPVSGIIPISQILAEHFLYLPSIGFFLLISWLLLSTISFLPISPRFCLIVFYSLIIPISLILLTKTISQTRIWHDPVTFYEYTLSKTTPTARVYNNLAMAYADARDYQKAITNYNNAISLGDVYPNPHYNLGNTLLETGRGEEAEKEYKRALEIDQNFHFATLKLGQLYLDQGKTEEAVKFVCPVFPEQPLCRQGLGL